MNIASMRRNIIEPLYYAWNRRPHVSYWREIESTQYLPEKVLRQRQWNRLKSMLDFAYMSNEFYRQRFDENGICPEDIQKHEDMPLIPVLTKKQIQESAREMISDGYRTENLMEFKTGGSTGKSLELYLTEECSELRNSCARRHDRWTGWEVGEPIAAVWGNPVVPVDLKSKFRAWLLEPKIYLDTMNVSEDSVVRFAKDWQRTNPTLIYGHAHSIYKLAEYVKNLEIDVIKPKGIISTSMMLMPRERLTIEEVFGVKVFDRYGCEEVSLIASECERHEGMHLNIEHLFIEFVKEDGTYASPGEPGRIIVTDLMNYAMPFIRYQVEDVGVPMQGKCSCGRGLPLMREVVGRTADFLVKRDGTLVAGISLIENTLTRIPGIDQMKVIQESYERIQLTVVINSNYSTLSNALLTGYFKDLFGNDVQIEIMEVAEIKPEPSGKYRFSICKITQPQKF